MIDILLYTRKLEEAGLNRDQAELMVRTQLNMISDNVVTKNDLMVTENDLKATITALESKFNSSLQSLEYRFDLRFKEIDHRFTSLENRLILKLGSLMVILVGVMASLHVYF